MQKLIDRTKDAAMKDLSNPADLASRGTFESWDVDNCAEIYAVDQALKDGVKIEDMFIRTVRFSDGAFADLCKNCQRTFSEFFKAME
ncbi:MAG: hypothetical protein GX270_07380 [Clostridiaceae bacterium]|nr:hypothetical protein [Clostridiaceae bacterium]